ncbi:hypothetical protein [Shewanella xiamenensis]|uniref:hypothetical protein n=1 Tax=Shewanella xiamenensis TaxID=332186 RepID=UPI000849E3F7|nr:hypothetical protein [Shewanella xiamenensis]ODR87069.1 hypothetical protein ABT47_18215 [Shewanella xiamenensis]
MPNTNPQGFERRELADFYEKLVLYFELNAGLKSVPLSASSKGYRRLKQELNLTILSANTLEEMAALMQQVATTYQTAANQVATDKAAAKQAKGVSSMQNLICVYNSEGNLLKSIFTQLRNAAAHAHIRRIKQGQICYHIEHVYPTRARAGRKGRSNSSKRPPVAPSVRFFCQMKKTDFWRFVESAKKLKSTAKSQANAQNAQPHSANEVAQ